MESPKPELGQEGDWIKRCQRGDREAFGFLAEKYQRRVFALVFHIVRRADQTEDLAQEIFIKAFLAIRGFNFRAPFGTWLAKIAVNHCYDYLRHERISRVSYYWQMSEAGQRQIEARLENPEGGLSAEQRVAVRDLATKLLDRAPAADRVILALKEMEDLSVEEIGEILDVKTSTVKVRLHRARKRMLEDFKQLRRGR